MTQPTPRRRSAWHPRAPSTSRPNWLSALGGVSPALAELTPPAPEQRVLDVQNVEHFSGNEIDESSNFVCSGVERRAGRHHRGARFIQREQVTKRCARQRHLPWYDDEGSPLFQGDVRCALQQVLRQADR